MCKRFLFRSVLRRGLFLSGSLAVILLAVFLPLSASAETINIKSGYGALTSNALITRYADGLPVDRLENQYFYGGSYNPLVMVDSQPAGYSWSDFDVSAYISFDRTVPAGTILRISCGGWFNKSYTFSSTFKPHMYVSPFSIADVSNGSYENYLGSRVLLGTGSGDTVQTPNGQYLGYLFSGTFTTRFPMSGIYLCFSGALASARTGGAYFGISCDSITISVDHVSPAESEIYGTPESGALDDTSAALGDLDNAESALLEANSSGLDYAAGQIQNAGGAIAQFHNSLQAVSYMFTQLLGRVPIFGYLLTISVSLGLIMLLFGLLGEVSSFSRSSFSRKESRIRRMDRARERSLAGRKKEQESRSKSSKKGD